MRIIPGLLLASLMLVACGGSKQEMARTDTFQRYEAIMRWSQFDALIDFMHPEWLMENPVSALDLQRLHQFQVSQYRVGQVLVGEEGSRVERLVRLHMINRHTARERVVDYVEVWRWDEERERWLLHSGLPDVTSRL